MYVRFKWLLLGVFLYFSFARAQAAQTQVELVFAAETVRPGDTVLAGLHVQMEPGWHSFWRNSGQSGTSTSNEWVLPAGVTLGEVQWPIPKKLVEHIGTDSLTTYIYENEFMLLVPILISSNAAPGPLEIKAKITVQQCKESCIPPTTEETEAKLEVGKETKPSKEASLIAAWQKKLPKVDPSLGLVAYWEKPATGDVRPLVLEWTSRSSRSPSDFFPLTSEGYEIDPTTRKLSALGTKERLRLQVGKSSGDWPVAISGLIVKGQGAEQVAYETKTSVSQPAPSAGSPMPATIDGEPSWPKMLLYAFLGGLILNVMPCVLPVIALKILGFVSDAQNEPRRVRQLGIVYTIGILFSFMVLAILTVALKAAGHAVGWGVLQFGNPYFLVVMTTLVTLIALNLFGVFEVTAGSTTLTAANQLASRQGFAGAFFNGFLATILATSCTAPVLSIALGYAASLSAPLLTVFWLTVGMGLAAPYLILSFQPRWLRFLPKPGPWMEKFKIAMGFPMIGAAVWLCSIAAVHYGDRTWWMVAFLVFLAVAAWVFGEFFQRGRTHRGLAALLAALLLVTGYAFALEHQLEWRKPVAAFSKNGPRRIVPKGLEWEPWSAEAVEAARAAGRPVVVDFTATWCPNCNIIVKTAFESSSVQKKLKEVGAVRLVADYSRPSRSITEELKRFKRNGVPLVLVYPKSSDRPPMVFDLPTSGKLIKALDQAARM